MDAQFNPIGWSLVEQLKPCEMPKFKPGDNVWVIHRREPRGETVNSVILKICEHGGQFVALCAGYDLGLYRNTVSGLTTEYYPYMLYASLEDARKAAAWYSTEGIPDKVWYGAFGVPREQSMSSKRRKKFNESVEFGSCCANVDRIRHLFLGCHQEGGMLERDRADVQEWLNAPDCDQVSAHPLSQKPNLAIILSRLNLTIPEPTAQVTSA